MGTQVVISTRRLRLRTWRHGDWKTFDAALNTDPVMQWLGGCVGRRMIRREVEWNIRHFERYSFCFFAAERKKDGMLVGFCGLIRVGEVASPIRGELEIGWRIAEPMWRRGYAVEAARAVIDWAAAKLPGQTVYARINVHMDDGLSAVDLTLLTQLLGLNLSAGVTADEYLEIVDALSDVQERMNSPAHLAWALDVAEALAIAPAPTSACVAARQQFFLLVVAKAPGFAHRLRAEERQAFRVLARDFALDRSALGVIDSDDETADEQELPDLSGKTVGIYTLTEAAGARAKHALEAMFRGLSVVLNADRVATSRLTNLARTADLFVFAWRSSSHSAFYCIKGAMDGRDPIMAAGKGTASIVRAVIDAVQ